MQSIYTGIGSRQTPPDILEMMTHIAQRLAQENWLLRSGGAEGADTAFELGAKDKEIFTPDGEIPKKAFEIAKEIYPNWHALKKMYVKRIMARNVMQILGQELNQPSQCVICYTPDGCTSHLTRNRDTGGTGQAIALASLHDIPILNLRNGDTLMAMENWLHSEKPFCLNDFPQPNLFLF